MDAISETVRELLGNPGVSPDERSYILISCFVKPSFVISNPPFTKSLFFCALPLILAGSLSLSPPVNGWIGPSLISISILREHWARCQHAG